MIYIERSEEPDFWKDYKKKHKDSIYDDLQNTDEGIELRRKLREYNIEQQHGLCAYCCKSISLDNSLNEHIKPKGVSQYAGLSMDYENLIVSCSTEGADRTCGASKMDKFDEKLFVSPLAPDCESYFEYYPNGEVVSDHEKGKYMIDLLSLNSFRLKKARAAQLKVCDGYKERELVIEFFLKPDINNRLHPYIDIVRYF